MPTLTIFVKSITFLSLAGVKEMGLKISYHKSLRVVLTAFICGFLFSVGSSSVSAQNADRQFGKSSGKTVHKAIKLWEKGKQLKAFNKLEEARALPGLNAYEISTIETFLGAYAFEMDDMTAAIQHYQNSVTANGLLPSEKKTVEGNIAELLVANGDYAEGAKSLTEWMQKYGENPKYVEYTMQAYVQAENYKSALPWAEEWFRQTNSPERKHYDLLNFLYNDLGKTDNQLSVIEDMIKIWPDDRTLWDSKRSILYRKGQEKSAYEVLSEMYDQSLISSEKEIMNLAFYHAYFGDEPRARSLLEKEYAAGRIRQKALPSTKPRHGPTGQTIYGNRAIPTFEAPQQSAKPD